jgi:hypothetical protein
MATIPSITVPNADAGDVLDALELRWKNDALKFFFPADEAAYDALTSPQKARECLKASMLVYTRNFRRDRAERAISVTDVDVT